MEKPYWRQNRIFKYPIITILGDTHYHEHEIIKRYNELSKNAIVFAPLDNEISKDMSDETLVDMCKEKIYLSDRIIVENVNGYIGRHTQHLIDFAESHDIPVEHMYDIPSNRIFNIKPGSLLYNIRHKMYFFVVSHGQSYETEKTFLYMRTSRPMCTKYDLNIEEGMYVTDIAPILFSRIHNMLYDDGIIYNFPQRPDNMTDWAFVKQVDVEVLNSFKEADSEYYAKREREE